MGILNKYVKVKYGEEEFKIIDYRNRAKKNNKNHDYFSMHDEKLKEDYRKMESDINDKKKLAIIKKYLDRTKNENNPKSILMISGALSGLIGTGMILGHNYPTMAAFYSAPLLPVLVSSIKMNLSTRHNLKKLQKVEDKMQEENQL